MLTKPDLPQILHRRVIQESIYVLKINNVRM
jgi:hypothetical protein